MIRLPLIRHSTLSGGLPSGLRDDRGYGRISVWKAVLPIALLSALAACGAPRDGIRLTESATTVPAEEAIAQVVTIFRELRGGQTLDGKNKLKVPSGVLSTAEAISGFDTWLRSERELSYSIWRSAG